MRAFSFVEVRSRSLAVSSKQQILRIRRSTGGTPYAIDSFCVSAEFAFILRVITRGKITEAAVSRLDLYRRLTAYKVVPRPRLFRNRSIDVVVLVSRPRRMYDRLHEMSLLAAFPQG